MALHRLGREIAEQANTRAPLRIGILGTGWAAYNVVGRVTRDVAAVRAVAVAGRDPARTQAFADSLSIPRAVGYDDLIESKEVDALYIALPNALHVPWTERALKAGKHVLCEKPIACNAHEAVAIDSLARSEGYVLCEALHWRYHPMAEFARRLVREGAIGEPTAIECVWRAAIPRDDPVRRSFELGGGVLMDIGCYAIHWSRFFVGSEPEVVSAGAEVERAVVDVAVKAVLSYPGGVEGFVDCSFEGPARPQKTVTITGTRGIMRIENPASPQDGHAIVINTPSGSASHQISGPSTYVCQLGRFAEAISDGVSLPTGGPESIANLRAIDAIYRTLGLPVRRSLTPDAGI